MPIDSYKSPMTPGRARTAVAGSAKGTVEQLLIVLVAGE